MKPRLVFILIFIFCAAGLAAQNTRLDDKNNIGWYAAFATLKFAPKWSIHYEYQWRRNNYITHWQQSLMRGGINYHLNDNITLRAGYGWIETHPYGEPVAVAFGKQFTEHRIFQALIMQNKAGRFIFTHRYMLEQRWLGRYSHPWLATENSYTYANRIRYQLRAEAPLSRTSLGKGLYAAAYDEIFIGFGKNVTENVFDQNRVALMLGYKLNDKLLFEGGYINQIVQLGRRIGASNVFQYNNGFIISAVINLNWQKNTQ